MDRPGGYLYAIGAVGTTFVKIGATSRSAQARLKSLQTGHPLRLEILAEVEVQNDLRRIEQQIHASLVAFHKHGEWFDILMERLQTTPGTATWQSALGRLVSDARHMIMEKEQVRKDIHEAVKALRKQHREIIKRYPRGTQLAFWS